MRKALIATLILILLLVGHATASTKPVADISRLAGGLDARALWVQETDQLYLDPALWLSYSLATNMSLSVSQGWNHKQAFDPLRAGLRLYVPDAPIQVALGVNYLFDWDGPKGQLHAWSVGAYSGWKLNSWLAGVGQAEKVLSSAQGDNPINLYLGLRAKLFGGGE